MSVTINEKKMEERLALKLAAHLRAHRLGAEDPVLVRAQAVRERRIHRLRRGLRAALGRHSARTEPRPDHVLVGCPELLDLSVADPRGVERAADLAGADRLHGR